MVGENPSKPAPKIFPQSLGQLPTPQNRCIAGKILVLELNGLVV
jgi:hypothetical protein